MTHTTNQPEADINEIISSAVNARVEAAVLEAMSGDQVMGRYVTAALSAPVKNEDRYGRSRTAKPETFLHHTVRSSIQKATTDAVKRVLAESEAELEDLVRKAIKAQAGDLAKKISQAMCDQASRGYGIQVQVSIPGEDDY